MKNITRLFLRSEEEEKERRGRKEYIFKPPPLWLFQVAAEKLMKVRRKYDLRIEPHVFRVADFNESHPLAAEIIQQELKLVRIITHGTHGRTRKRDKGFPVSAWLSCLSVYSVGKNLF